MNKLHIILGDQPNADGTRSDGHKVRLDAMLEALKPGDIVICTGGVTVAGAASEAALAGEYLQSQNIGHELILEDTSRTTAQNYRFTKKYLDLYPNDEVVVYCGKAQLPKAKVLQWWLWPKRNVKYVTLLDHRGVSYQLPQLFLGTLLSLFDPYEVWIGKLALKRGLREQVLE